MAPKKKPSPPPPPPQHGATGLCSRLAQPRVKGVDGVVGVSKETSSRRSHGMPQVSRHGSGVGHRLEGDISSGGDDEPPKRSRTSGAKRELEALKKGSAPRRRRLGVGLHHEGKATDHGVVGELSTGGSVPTEDGRAYICCLCHQTFRRASALHGHMNVHKAASLEEPPSPKPKRARKSLKPKRKRKLTPTPVKKEEAPSSVSPLTRGWGTTSRRFPPRSVHVAAEERPAAAPAGAVVPGGLAENHVGADVVDQPWAAEMLQNSAYLISMSSGEVAADRSGDLVNGNGPPSQNAEVNVSEPESNPTVSVRNIVVGMNEKTIPEIIVIPDDTDDDDTTMDTIYGDEDDAEADIAAGAVVSSDAGAAAAFPPVAPAPAVAAESVTVAPATAASSLVTMTAAPAPSAASAMATAATPDVTLSIPKPGHARDFPRSSGRSSRGRKGYDRTIVIGGKPRIVRNAGYSCKECDKTFSSPQGLGGHVAGHRNCQKRSKQNLDAAAMVTEIEGPNAVPGSDAVNRERVYACKRCSMVFESGPALGGHMRTHYSPEVAVDEPDNSSSIACIAAPTAAAAHSSSPSLSTVQLNQEDEPPVVDTEMDTNASAVHAPADVMISPPPAVLALPALNQVAELPEEMVMAGHEGTGGQVQGTMEISSSLTTTSSSSFVSIPVQNQQEENPAEEMVATSGNTIRTIRLFGVNIGGPKEDSQ